MVLMRLLSSSTISVDEALTETVFDEGSPCDRKGESQLVRHRVAKHRVEFKMKEIR